MEAKHTSVDSRYAFEEFAGNEMPWLLDDPENDTERLMRTTALIAFQRGWESAIEKSKATK